MNETPRTPLLFLALCLLMSLLGSCAGAPPFDARAVLREWVAFMERDYVLRPGDKIAVSVYKDEELSLETVVSPTGTVSLKRLDREFRAAGKSIGALRREIQAAYAKIFRKPEVNVSLVEPTARSIYVAGEVRTPGAVPYVPGMTLSQALASAGGLGLTAKWSDVRILRNDGRGRDHTYRVNVDSVLHEGTPDFLLLPGDVVYAQTSGIADVGDFIELYIRRILPIPITGFAVGMGY